jgi:hypothetical protein
MLYDSSKSFLGLHVPKNVLPPMQTPTDPDRTEQSETGPVIADLDNLLETLAAERKMGTGPVIADLNNLLETLGGAKNQDAKVTDHPRGLSNSDKKMERIRHRFPG